MRPRITVRFPRHRGDRQNASGNRVIWVAIALFLASLFPALALADGGEAPATRESVPSFDGLLDGSETGAQVVPSPRTDPTAAEGMNLGDMDRGEALEVLSGVFEEEVSSAGKDPSELPVKRYLAPDVAVVSAPESGAGEDGPGGSSQESEEEGAEEASSLRRVASPPHLAGADLVDSTVPLQVEGAGGQLQPVDLALEQEGGELEPASPLVDTAIPSELGEGVELLNGKIGLSFPAAAQERSPSLVEESLAFYPNVAPDTDLAVVPTLTGLETFTQLRSADAPTSQRIALDLPAGTTLRASEAGGAEAVKDGELLLSVLPPTAIDADGEPVATTLEVQGEALVLKVHPSESAAMPILVDPLFQTYEWNAKGTTAGICSTSTGTEGSSSSCNNREEWGFDIVSHYPLPSHMQAGVHDLWSSTFTPGMSVLAQGAQTMGDRASVVYTVPRFFKDETLPTSFISHLTLSNLDWMGYGAYPSPYLFAGIWDPVTGGWASYWMHSGQAEHGVHDWTYRYEFPNPVNTHAKAAGIILSAQESTPDSAARAYVGYASVELADQDVPTSPIPKAETKWVDQEAPPLSFSATDTGLGVKSITAATEGVGSGRPLHSWSASYGCLGVGDSACPRTWSSTQAGHEALTYQPSLVPNGINYLSLVSEDPVGNRSASSFAEVRVDHQAPALSLSGNLTEQNIVGRKLTEYTLNYSATDGEDTAAAASTPIGSAGTGTGQMQDPRGVAVDASGNVWVVDRVNKRIEKFSPTGSYITEFPIAGAVEPTSIAVNSAGNLWVADPGAKRVQLIKSNSVVLRTISYQGFNSPYAVATGPNETLWVSDIAGHTIYRFREDGTLLGQVSNVSAGAVYSVVAMDTDASGNLWAAEQTTNKILEFSPTGSYLFSFGTSGSGNGQLNAPNGLAIAPSGNLLVADTLNNRVEVFNPEGAYLRKFGASGTGSANLSGPRDLAVGPGNIAYIGDTSNSRIARWSHADQNPQSGAAKVEVKVDGTAAKTVAPGCTTKNCTINGSWVLKADEYAAGIHEIKVTATDAVGRATTKVLNIETHGDRTAPTLALSGSMSEQATLGTTRPSYLLKVSATDPATLPYTERSSGVASTTIKVDGVTVDSFSPGCPSGGCSINREWTLSSNSYSPGAHSVQVQATDATGRTSTKTLAITIERDTTAPQFEELGGFYTAPEGWVEQKPYSYTANATDTNGYGVTVLTLKIDGSVVKTATQTCPAGGCTNSFGSVSINMEDYSGGSHPAELIATDGAGNTRRRTWTINVDPEGHISTAELADTLEAVEETSYAHVVSAGAEAAEGPEVSVHPTSAGFGSVGSYVPTYVSSSPAGGVRMEPSGYISEGAPEEVAPQLVLVTPDTPGAGATEAVITEGSAVVAANTGNSSDSVTRPVYDGALTFHDIRDRSASEEYSWDVQLPSPGEYMSLVDPQHVEVYYANGHPAFGVAAMPAADAVGTSVPTNLKLEGHVVTEVVHHRSASFVYPVVVGVGWEGGYVTTQIPGPKDEKELREEREQREREEKEGLVRSDYSESEELTVGPPEPIPSGEATASDIGSQRKEYVRVRCGHTSLYEPTNPSGSVCGNPFTGKHGENEIWNMAIRGAFFFHPAVEVYEKGAIACDQSGRNIDIVWIWYVKEAYQCHYGAKTSDGNGGASARAGHYLRAQAHWELGHRAQCGDSCGSPNPAVWEDRAMELHLWPSGAVDVIDLDP